MGRVDLELKAAGSANQLPTSSHRFFMEELIPIAIGIGIKRTTTHLLPYRYPMQSGEIRHFAKDSWLKDVAGLIKWVCELFPFFRFFHFWRLNLSHDQTENSKKDETK